MPKSLVDLVSEKVEPLVAAPHDFNSVIDFVGDPRFVLEVEETFPSDL